MKILFIVTGLFFAGVVNAQTELQKKKAEFYAAEAITYFKLNESKKKDVAEAKLNLMIAQKEMERKKKAGELSEADSDAYRKMNVYPNTQKILDIVGVNFKVLNEFNEIVHPKMNQIKE